MSKWGATKAKRVLAALFKIGWTIKRQSGSHRVLSRDSWSDVVFAFHDGQEIGPRMLLRIAKETGLQPSDLWEEKFHRKLVRNRNFELEYEICLEYDFRHTIKYRS